MRRSGAVSLDPVSAFEPWPRRTLVAAPDVQVTVTVPLPCSALLALVTIGSYAPKATAAVEIVQLLDTVAVTLKLAVAEPAKAAGPGRQVTDSTSAIASFPFIE